MGETNYQRMSGDEVMTHIAKKELSEMLQDHDEFIETGKVTNPYRIGFQGDETQIFDPVIFTKKDKIHIGNHCRIDGFTKIEGGQGVIIGDYVHVASFAHLNVGGGRLWVGCKAAIASHAVIITGGNRSDGISMSASAPLEDQVLLPGAVVINQYAAVLVGAILLPNVCLNEGAVVGAGALVPANVIIPAWEIWAGNPARKIGERQLLPGMRK